MITKLKKKVKSQKDKLKKLESGPSPVRSEHNRTHLKVNKSYKSFVKAEERQKSYRKVVPSDIG
jgi:hypothetical protein